MQKKRIFLFIIVLIVISLLGAIFYWNRSKQYLSVSSIEVQNTLTVTGYLTSNSKILVKAPLTGTIAKLYIDEGETVFTNQLLAQYEKDKYVYQMNELSAGKRVAELNYKKMKSGHRIDDVNRLYALYQNNLNLLKQKELEYQLAVKEKERNDQLFQEKVITEKEYDESLSLMEQKKELYQSQKNLSQSVFNEYKLIKAGNRKEDIGAAYHQVQQLDAQTGVLRTLSRKTDVKAEIQGVVLKRYIDNHDFVMEGDKLFLLSNNHQLEIDASIEEEDIVDIHPGQPVQLELDAYPEKILKGKLRVMIDNVDPETRMIPVKIQLMETPSTIKLMQGMTVNCTFIKGKEKRLTIPLAALFKEGKRYYVKTKSGRKDVHVMGETGQRAFITGDLHDGEMVERQ